MSSSKYDGAGVSPEAFQKIIRERKAEKKEKAQLKRIHDLKRIEEMNSGDGWNPLARFPKEIWELILHELNPEDRGNMWELHPVFRDLMQKSHVRDNLFPQILTKLYTSQFWNNSESSPDFNEEELDVDYKNAVVPLANHLMLREVSKSLRNEIDRYIEKEFLYSLGERRMLQYSEIPGKTTFFAFQLPFEEMDKDLEEILNYIKSNPKSETMPRFISKSLTISIDLKSYTVNENVLYHFVLFGSKILSFLEHFGSQFWRFELKTSDNARCRLNGEHKLYIPLNMWVALMPNLKWFSFRHISEKSRENRFDLEDLPKLESLERMDIYIKSRATVQASFYVKSLLKAQTHIKVLRLHWGKAPTITLSPLKALETIHVCLDSDFYKMQKAIGTPNNWSLKRMFLSINMHNDSIIPVFQFLQKFPTLEKLSLIIRDVNIGGGIDFLRLPRLQDFAMQITNPQPIGNSPFHFFFSLQFLLHSKDLKTLKLNCFSAAGDHLKEKQQKKKCPGNMLDLGSGWDDLFNSNIWQVFPYLEHVDVLLRVVHDQNARKINSSGKRYYKGKLVESYQRKRF